MTSTLQRILIRFCGRGMAALIALGGISTLPALGQGFALPQRIANIWIEQDAKSQAPPSQWDEEQGTLLEGMDELWYNTANGDYFRYVKRSVDNYLSANPVVAVDDDSPSYDLLGRQLLLLYRVTLDARYYKAAASLRQQIAPLCKVGDADSATASSNEKSTGRICRAEPFLAEYASLFQQPQDFNSITHDFAQWELSLHRPAQQPLNRSPSRQEEDRAWLAVALVEALVYYPKNESGRSQLIEMLNHQAAAALKNHGVRTDTSDATKKETEARPTAQSAACLLIYAALKAVRLDYLTASYADHALRAWRRISNDSNALASHEIAGAGALLLAANEAELAPIGTLARGDTVLLDAWYNSQQRKNALGQTELFHYKWNDLSDSGYSLFGHMFRSFGAATATLDSAPTQKNLSGAQFYIIVSPDIPVKNPNPHYMASADADSIAAWVKQGGVLVMMENDPPNADITHLNLLADKFGIHFDDVLHHHVIGEHIEDGRIPVAPDGQIFRTPHTLYMKDTCAITVKDAAIPLLRDRGDVVMAMAKYGTGAVFAAVDPWVYNEYTDGRKNPQIYRQFDNFAAGKELVRWLLQQSPKEMRQQ